MSDFSSSTSEDASSDEDYCEYSYKPVKGGRGRGGRRRCTTRDSTYHPDKAISPISHSPSPIARMPPPLISNSEVDLLEIQPPETKLQKTAATPSPIKIISPVKDFKPAVPDLVPIKSVKSQSPMKPVVIGSSAHSTSSGLVQYYQVPGGVQSLVPVQLVSHVQSSTYTAPPGSVIMLQPTGSGGGPQRVSVIMNPRPSPSSTSYITQLDGSLPQHHLPISFAQLQDEFDSMRKKAKQTLLDQQEQLVSHNNNHVTPTCRGAKRKVKAAPAAKETSTSPSPHSIGPPQKKKRKVGSSDGGAGGGKGESSGHRCKECSMAFPTAADLLHHCKTTHTAPLHKILPKKSHSKGSDPQDDSISIQTSRCVSGRGKAVCKPTKESTTQKKPTLTKKFSCRTCKEAFDSAPNLSAHVFAAHAKLPVSLCMMKVTSTMIEECLYFHHCR